jgi:cold shock CspA family protein
MRGKIERISTKQGHGFIRADSGEEFYFDRYDLEGVNILAFEVGDTVEFVLEQYGETEKPGQKR